MWLIWPNQKFQKLLLLYGSWNAVNKQYISQFWFLKLTKQINCPCKYINIKIFFDAVIYNEHISRDTPFL